MKLNPFGIYRTLEASHRVLQKAVRMGDSSMSKRDFLRATLGLATIGVGLGGCKNEVVAPPDIAPQTQVSNNIGIKYVPCSAEYPNICIANCLQENPAAADIFEALRYLDSEDSMKDYCFSTLLKMPEVSQHLRTIINEGGFMPFYLACQYLARSDAPKADETILSMVRGNKTWEKALGLILLITRAAEGKISPIIAKSFISAFLQSRDPLLKLAASVAFPSPDFELWPPMSRFTTAFFRHPEVLDELIRGAKQSFSSQYTVWDVGCSLGLTTESMRIALKEETNKKIKIIGTDINPFALVYAARGKFLLDAWALIGTVGVFTVLEEEKRYFEAYANSRGWNPEAVLGRSFYKNEKGPLGPVYEPKSEQEGTTFAYDDITDPNSIIPDNSVDTVVYANVHVYLSEEGQKRAAEKINRKLKLGGRVIFINPGGLKYAAEVTRTFGQPAKEDHNTFVFVKKIP